MLVPDTLSSQVHIRAGRESDKNLLYDSWLHSYFCSATDRRKRGDYIHALWPRSPLHPGHGNDPDGPYFPQRRKVIDRLVARAGFTVACSPDDDDTILAWICWEYAPGTVVTPDSIAYLHYVWVKDAFRRQGVMSLLFRRLPQRICCTHMTDVGKNDEAGTDGGSFESMMVRWRHKPDRPILTFNKEALLTGEVEI